MRQENAKSLRNKSLAKKIIALSFVWIVIAFLYIPLILLMVFSFVNSNMVGVWGDFTFKLYAALFKNAQLMGVIGNTFLIAGISAFLATIIGSVSAVGIFYLKKRPRKLANALTQITVINADIVTGVSLMMFFLLLNLKGGYPTVIIAHTLLTLPFVILSVLPRLSQLNPNLYEAGLDCGASPMRTLFTVVFPQLIPSMIAGFALAFTLSLDDFVITKFTNGNNVNTISTYIYSKMVKGGLPPALRAVSTIMFVGTLLILIGINVHSSMRAKKIKNGNLK